MNTSMNMRATISNNTKLKTEEVLEEDLIIIKLFKVPNLLELIKIIKVLFPTITKMAISIHLYS